MNIADIPTARNAFMKLRHWLCERCIHGRERQHIARHGKYWACAGHNQLVDILDERLCRYFEHKKSSDDLLFEEAIRRWGEIMNGAKRF